MSRIKKYFKDLAEARAVLKERKKRDPSLGIHKMPKGTRQHGMYAVCSYFEWLNTY